jgi:hypothetical protein
MMQNRSNLSKLTRKSYFTNFISKFFYLLAKQLGIRKLITCNL